MNLYGVLCRILWYSSLAWDTASNITIELATPRTVGPDGILFCFPSESYAQPASSIAVQSLQVGGSIWETAGELQLSAAPASAAGNVPTTVMQLLPSVVTLTARDVVNSAAYYTTSFAANRYDDLLGDQSDTDSPLPAELQQLLSTASSNSSRAAGPCMLVSGAWQAGTRYQLTLSFSHPPSPKAQGLVLPPALWMVPVTYSNTSSSSAPAAARHFAVRGSKRGQMCTLRPQAAALLPRMFSACDEAARNLLPLAGSIGANTSTQDCVAALQAAVTNLTSLNTTFPFNLPPVATWVNMSSTAAAAVPPGSASPCPAGWLRGPRFGGECINCTHAAIQGSSCTCLPGYSSNLIGPDACGPPIMPAGNASDAADLARQLCATYSSYFDSMMRGELSDRLVHSMFLAGFARQAAYLLDWAALQQANTTFWRELVTDERMPASPSRQAAGIGPGCTACTAGGQFRDIYSKQQVVVRDDRFLAVNTFRLIGFLLAGAGHPCAALWDQQQPRKWVYGRHDKTMCAAM